MDRDARTRARLEQHWKAPDRGDIDTEHTIYAADAVLDYREPQHSGLPDRGPANRPGSSPARPATPGMTVDARPSPAAPARVGGTRRGARDMDMKLEVVVVPVSDVDRAKDFYQALGWRLDADFVTATAG
jgi:hypothetical protein